MTNEKMDNKYVYLANNLKIECEKCSGLCCIALYCTKTDGFPSDKKPGKPCKYLLPDFRCEIYSELTSKKMRGCLTYDCFGAGQKTTQIVYPAVNWRIKPSQSDEIFRVFMVIFQLHQMLWYLVEAFSLSSDENIKLTIEELILKNEQMTQQPPEEIIKLNIEEYRLDVNKVLKQVINMISIDDAQKIRNTDFSGKDFKKMKLDGRDFSMSLMIAANLEGCSLQRTCFLGADMRGANLKNTNLSESIFLTQMQLNSAKGNMNTQIPESLSRPTNWK